jgi:hypothetical protein
MKTRSNDNIDVPTVGNASLSFADLSLLERELADESVPELAVESKDCATIAGREEPLLVDVSVIDEEVVQSNGHARAPLDFAIASKSNSDTAKPTWCSLTQLSDEKRWCAPSDTDRKRADFKADCASVIDEIPPDTHVEKTQSQPTSSPKVPADAPQQQRVRESALSWVEEVAYGKKCKNLEVIEDLIWGPAPEFESSPSKESGGRHAEKTKQSNERQPMAHEQLHGGTISPSASTPARPKRPPRCSAYRSTSRDMPRLPGASGDDEPPEDGQTSDLNYQAPSLKTSRPRGCTRVVSHRMAPAGGA